MMKASQFSEAQKAFILKQGRDGMPVAEICRKAGISQATYFNWKKKYDGLLPTEMRRLKQLEDENNKLRRVVADLSLDKAILKEAAKGHFLSPSRRRVCIEQVRQVLDVSERRACSVLCQHRSTQRKRLKDDADERLLTADIRELARLYGRYGYRRIHALLAQAGWDISLSVVERIWRREGLKVPQKQPKRRRLWLNDGSCIRLRPERPGHVWSYDFVEDITWNGRKYRMLNIVDEFSRECLAMVPQRRFHSDDVLAVLADLFVEHGPPEHVRSDNGPEFAARPSGRGLARSA
jgi:transposase InsO family protein